MLSYFQKQSVHDQLHKVPGKPTEQVWVSGIDVTSDDMNEVTERFSLDPNIVRDVLDKNELSRLEHTENALYVFVRTPHLSKRGELHTTPMLIVLSSDVFMTLSRDAFDGPSELSSIAQFDNLPSLLLSTIAAVISAYESCIRHTGKYIQDTDRRLKTHEVTNADFIRFVTIETGLNSYHTNLSGVLAVIERLRDNNYAPLQQTDIEAADDIMLHIKQLLVAVNGHIQAVTSIRNAHSTIANNTLNQRMKTLTVLTVLLAIPNVFYGMFGMNVMLPFAEEPWAYFAIVGFTALLILTVYGVAKRFRVF